MLLSALAIFGRVWNQTQAVRLVDELAALKKGERELVLEQEEQRRELLRLTTRERVAEVARHQLRMEYPTENEVVFLAVPGVAEAEVRSAPRRDSAPDEGFTAFFRKRLRGVVSREAYAISTM